MMVIVALGLPLRKIINRQATRLRDGHWSHSTFLLQLRHVGFLQHLVSLTRFKAEAEPRARSAHLFPALQGVSHKRFADPSRILAPYRASGQVATPYQQ